MVEQARNVALLFGQEAVRPKYLPRDHDGKFVRPLRVSPSHSRLSSDLRPFPARMPAVRYNPCPPRRGTR
jgi:hypothetical protein